MMTILIILVLLFAGVTITYTYSTLVLLGKWPWLSGEYVSADYAAYPSSGVTTGYPRYGSIFITPYIKLNKVPQEVSAIIDVFIDGKLANVVACMPRKPSLNTVYLCSSELKLGELGPGEHEVIYMLRSCTIDGYQIYGVRLITIKLLVRDVVYITSVSINKHPLEVK